MLQSTHIISKASRVFCLLLLALVIPFSPAKGAQKYAQIAPEVMDAIESVAQNSAEKALLMNIVILESSGSKKPPKTFNTRNGTWDWGITQINDVSIPHCVSHGIISAGPPSDYGRGLMTQDPLPALRCALVIYAINGSSCTTYSAKLCAYNHGGCYCVGCPKKGITATPDKSCGYSEKICNGTGTDCNTGVIGNNPYTGKFNVQRTTDVGNKGEPVNCPKLRLAQDIEHATQSAQISFASTVQKIEEEGIRSFRNYPKKYKELYGNLFNTYCVDFKLTVFGRLRQLGSWVKMWDYVIDAALNYILDAACDLVVTAINNALSSICIPLPNFNFGFSIGSLPQTSCSGGVSLNDLVKAVPGKQIPLPQIKLKDAYEGIKRGIKGEETYPVH